MVVDPQVQALLAAAYDGSIARMHSLIDADPSLVWEAPNDITALHVAAFMGSVEAVEFLVSKRSLVNARGRQGTPLYQAVAAGHEDVVEALLAMAADPNLASAAGETPLMAAAAKNLLRVALLLLERGADPNACTGEGTTDLFRVTVPVCGESAVHLAAAYGSPELLRALIEHGASLEIEDRLGQRPLHWAARHHRDDLLALLPHDSSI